MLRVGLTGGIGSGKSTVAARLAEHGAVIIDADVIAREVVEPGTEGLAEVTAEFGEEVIGSAGALDRKALAAKVFSDNAARGKLNAILHPRIAARTGELMSGAAEDAILLHDVPLLVENHLAPAYHLVIVVHADEDERVARLTRDRDMTEAQARERIAAQATDAQRRVVADAWLDNGAGRDEVLAVVDALWTDRLVPYEANLRLGRIVKLGRPKVVGYDEQWPVTARRLLARIAAAVGKYPAQHIGSTAVPGLAAKPVIDLQLLVPDLDTADTLADSLARAGFPRVEGDWWDSPKPEQPDPAAWRKRLHGSADPGCPVNLHVRTLDGPGARAALLFRDMLRAEPTIRAGYEQVKLGLAEAHSADGTTEQYAAAREPWFDKTYPAAQEWASRSDWHPDIHAG